MASMLKNKNQAGFFTMLLMILIILAVVIWLAFKRLHHTHG